MAQPVRRKKTKKTQQSEVREAECSNSTPCRTHALAEYNDIIQSITAESVTSTSTMVYTYKNSCFLLSSIRMEYIIISINSRNEIKKKKTTPNKWKPLINKSSNCLPEVQVREE